MLFEGLLLKGSCSFSVKEVILTWGSVEETQLDDVEITELLDEIERRTLILDYF